MLTIDAVTHLDRASHRRSDADWLTAEQQLARTRTILLMDLKPLVRSDGDTTELACFTAHEIAALDLTRALDQAPAIFLGIGADNAAWFAQGLTGETAARVQAALPDGCMPLELRHLAMAGQLAREPLSLAGQARAILEWHRATRCCGRCGGVMLDKDGGWRRQCWACGRDAFPRTDPVVIMLPVSGDRCVLARGAHFPPHMYSALAGFLEPGEDIERAVRREVHEEVGLTVGDVMYQESQPWPFPHSLMIGCRAMVDDTDLTIDPKEIAEAFWVDRRAAQKMLAGTHPEGWQAPGRHAIARELLSAFAEDRPLRSLPR